MQEKHKERNNMHTNNTRIKVTEISGNYTYTKNRTENARQGFISQVISLYQTKNISIRRRK